MNKAMCTIKYGAIYGLILLAILALGAIAMMAREASAQYIYTGNTINDPTVAKVNSAWQIVNSISPSSASINAGAETVTITGEGFSPTSIARVNGSNRPTTFIDGSHLLVQVYASDMHRTDGGFYINVFDSTGGRYSNSAYFTINGYVAQKNITPSGTVVQNTNTSNSNNYNNSNSNTNTTGSVEGAQTTNSGSANDNYGALASNAIYGSNSFMPSGLVQWLLFAIFILIVVIVIRKIFFADNYQAKPLKHA